MLFELPFKTISPHLAQFFGHPEIYRKPVMPRMGTKTNLNVAG